MDLLTYFDNIVEKSDSEIGKDLNGNAKLVGLFCLYHYLDGDVSHLDDVSSSLCFVSPSDFQVESAFKSIEKDGNAIDFIAPIETGVLPGASKEFLDHKIKSAVQDAVNVIFHLGKAKERIQHVYDSLNPGFYDDNDSSYVIKFLCNSELDPESKIKYQEYFSGFATKNGKLSLEIIFPDDIKEEIDDVESPKGNVSDGSLFIYGDPKGSICHIGLNNSFITVVSAKSLKSVFLKYSTNGLFASNLRFFISSKKIDPKILETINNDPDDFVYLNNGIIVTCDNCQIKGNELLLTNFSIVNGGQTTNLIGRSEIKKDFGVVCKIIQNKYDDQSKKEEFLSKVAEASNTQKPINAKDLIANRVEQRLLKSQCANCGIFLKVKRGEKINREQYPEPWQNASNDELAQMIYSVVFQSPGSAKNSKSSILSNEKTYNVIFKNTYSDTFIKSLQHLKAGFYFWKKYVLKRESYGTPIYGLSKSGDLLTLAVIGLLEKLYTNDALIKQLKGIKDISNGPLPNNKLQFLLRHDDIGHNTIIPEKLFDVLSKNSLFGFFDYIYSNFLINQFLKFRKDYPNFSYGNFSKTDSYYYVYVANDLIDQFLKNSDRYKSTLSSFMDLNLDSSKGFDTEISPENYHPGLRIELEDLNWSRNILNDSQIGLIVKFMPHNTFDLSFKCGLDSGQIEKFGSSIIDIVKKYQDLGGFSLNDD